MMQPCARPVRPRCRLTGILVAKPRTPRSCFRRQIKQVAFAIYDAKLWLDPLLKTERMQKGKKSFNARTGTSSFY